MVSRSHSDSEEPSEEEEAEGGTDLIGAEAASKKRPLVRRKKRFVEKGQRRRYWGKREGAMAAKRARRQRAMDCAIRKNDGSLSIAKGYVKMTEGRNVNVQSV